MQIHAHVGMYTYRCVCTHMYEGMCTYSFDELETWITGYMLFLETYLSLMKAAKEEKAKEFNFLFGPNSVSSTKQGARVTEMPSLVPI